MEGIFIPMEFLEREELTITECMVLSIYRYYTIKGKQHCCSLRNDDICKIVRLKDKRNFRRIKRHLKELGYIRTDGGVRVIYLGVGGDLYVTIEGASKPSGEGIETPPGEGIETPQGRVYKSPGEGIETPHKEEEKIKKEEFKEEVKEEENKKEEERWEYAIKLIFGSKKDSLPKEYHTKENVIYVRENYKEILNEIDIDEGGVLKSWTDNLKNELSYPGKYYVKKEEPKSDTIDVT